MDIEGIIKEFKGEIWKDVIAEPPVINEITEKLTFKVYWIPSILIWFMKTQGYKLDFVARPVIEKDHCVSKIYFTK